MAHKTLTISEEAYNALAQIKGRDESFTKAILRLTNKKAAGNLLDYVRSFSPDEELASAVEKVLEKRGKLRLRSPELSLSVCEKYGRLTNELKAKGSPIGDLDTLVASTALVHRQILLTRDKAHFEKVPGLVVESW